jgi:AcrR family transcriptional regulator
MVQGASSRLARRQAATRARIVAVAARRFAREGLEGVRLDEVADQADVARGTLYNYFPSKESLVAAVVRPVLELAARRSRGLHRLGPRQGVDALLALYLELWREHADALRLSHRLPGPPPGDLVELHESFLQEVFRIFERCARAGLLRCSDGRLGALLMARLAVPLLELCSQHPRGDALFVESLDGLLLQPGRPGRAPTASKRRAYPARQSAARTQRAKAPRVPSAPKRRAYPARQVGAPRNVAHACRPASNPNANAIIGGTGADAKRPP